jgi:prepilin-type N-terminal cleavage/methylation domain-containing protein
MAAGKKRPQGTSWESLGSQGFTLLELLVTIAILGILSMIAIPAVSSYRGKCALEATAIEICGMIREGKQRALDEGKYGILFDTATDTISLIAKGADDEWNTADDRLIRSFRLANKGGGLRFGYESYGPVETSEGHLAVTTDGVSFGNNRLVCNEELTGNAGAIYIRSSSGAAVAMTMNSFDYGYKIYSWNGRSWVKR